MGLRLPQPSWRQEERICLKMAGNNGGKRDGERRSCDFITSVIESKCAWIVELFDDVRCFLFFFFLKPLWHKFVSLCIHKRESWLTTVFLTSLSGTVSWCGPPTCDLRSHLNPLTPWNYSSYFHLCFCICFGTTNMVRTICHLTGFKGFSQVLYHITSTLQMRKLRIRELKRPCDQGHTVNRLWSPAQSFWPSGVCSFIHTCRRQWRGLRRCREYPPLVNKILCLLYPTFPSCSLLACPHSPNLLFGAAVCPTSAQ